MPQWDNGDISDKEIMFYPSYIYSFITYNADSHKTHDPCCQLIFRVYWNKILKCIGSEHQIRPNQKSRNQKEPMLRLIQYLKPYKYRFVNLCAVQKVSISKIIPRVRVCFFYYWFFILCFNLWSRQMSIILFY